MMWILVLIFLPFSWVSASSSPKLLELQLKTQDVYNAGMDLEGNLSFDICSGDQCCYMYTTDLPYDQFRRGLIEGFTGRQLEECENFSILNDTVTEMKVTHSGPDGWLGEYIRLLLDNGTYFQCNINDWMDDGDHVYLECLSGTQSQE